MRFCKTLNIDVREYAHFRESGTMLGLSIPLPADATERKAFIAAFEEKFFSCEKISEKNETVRNVVYKLGTYYYDLFFFEGNVSIGVNSATNPELYR